MTFDNVYWNMPVPVGNAILIAAAEKVAARQRERNPVSLFPTSPHSGPQQSFVEYEGREALYGGAAGGGKTEALIRSAAKYFHVPGYSAIIFRRTYPQLSAPDGLIGRTHELFAGKAKWHEGKHRWTFPSGATLTLAQLQYEKTVWDHLGPAYQFVGFDELTQFTEFMYKFFFGRQRRPSEGLLSKVPLRLRGATNPGGIGHNWVKRRFLTHNDKPSSRVYVPAKLSDNPSLDAPSYIEGLMELPPTLRARMLNGDWDASEANLLTYDLIEAAEFEDCLWPMGVMPAGFRGELYAGVDVGRTTHNTVIWVYEKTKDNLLFCRHLEVIHGKKFSEQKALIRPWCENKYVCKLHIDKGGIGAQLAEELESEYRKVEGVQLTRGKQGQLAGMMKSDFEDKRVRIPEDADLQEDLMQVSPTEVQNGQIVAVATEEGPTGHADRFWAAALARYGVPHKPKKKYSSGAPRAGASIHNPSRRVA